MAKRGRRGGGELQARIGSFFASALQQLGTVREVVTQQAKEGKSQLDLALLRRRRKAALADLGAAVARLAADGAISEDDFPELSAPLSRLEAIDEQIDGMHGRGYASSADDDEDAGAVRGWREHRRDEDDDDEPYTRRKAEADDDDRAADDAATGGADPYDDAEPTEEVDDDDGRYDPVEDDDEDAAAAGDDAAAGDAGADEPPTYPDESTRDGRPPTKRR